MTTRKVKLILLAAWGVPILSGSLLFVDIQVFASVIFVFGLLISIVIVMSYRMIIKRINREVKANLFQTTQNTSNHQNHKIETSRNPCPLSVIDSHNSDGDQGPVSSASNRQTGHSNNSTVDAVQQQNQQNRALRIAKNKKLARRLFTLIAAYGCCILPSVLLAVGVLLVKIIGYVGVSLDDDVMDPDGPFRVHLRFLTTIATVLNSLLNPLIYTYTYPKFRAELRKMFCWLPLVGRKNAVANIN